MSCSRASAARSAMAAGTSRFGHRSAAVFGKGERLHTDEVTTPVQPFSSPMGSWTGTISRAQLRRSDSSVRSTLARSRSRRFATTTRGRLRAAGLGPQLLRLHFDARHGIHDDERTLDHTQRGSRVGQEVANSRGIDDVELGLLPLGVGQAGREGVLARDGLLVEIRDVEPSSTLPRRLTAPAANSMADTSCVLPHPL